MRKKLPYIYYDIYYEQKSFTKPNNNAKKQNTLKFKSNIQYDNI